MKIVKLFRFDDSTKESAAFEMFSWSKAHSNKVGLAGKVAFQYLATLYRT